MSQRFDDDPHLDLDRSLEPELRALLDRHKEAAARIDWSYHEFVPLDAHRTGALTEFPLPPSTYTAVEMALLTEVNLPWYTAGLSHGLDSCPDPIREFVHLWTSEEDQHATLLESYLLLTDNGDHAARARSRKTIVAAGWHHALSGQDGHTPPRRPRAPSTSAWREHVATSIRCSPRRCAGSPRTRPCTWPSTATS